MQGALAEGDHGRPIHGTSLVVAPRLLGVGRTLARLGVAALSCLLGAGCLQPMEWPADGYRGVLPRDPLDGGVPADSGRRPDVQTPPARPDLYLPPTPSDIGAVVDEGPGPEPDTGTVQPDLAQEPDVPTIRDAGRPPDPDTGPGPDPLEPRWERCPGEGMDLQCATVRVPLDWGDPEGRRIDYRLRRIRARVQRRAQLWLLQGGPGAPGDALIDVGRFFADQLNDVEVYVPDHRGTGGSQWLGCPGSPDPLGPDCVRRLERVWGDDLLQFSVTQAARDVGEMIEVERIPDERVLVWGVSYGTFLVNRYLHIFPAQADAVMLDSSCPPDTCPAVDWDRNFHTIGLQYLQGCSEDRDCRAHLGEEPVERLQELYAALDAGHCPDLLATGLDREGLKFVLALLLRYAELRPLIPVIIHRALRCGGDDRVAMQVLVEFLDGMAGEPEPGDSDLLALNIFKSEFWPGDPGPDELAAIHAGLLVSDGGSVQLAEAIRAWPWPAYPQAAEWDAWAPLLQPALLLNGTLDPQTPHFLLESAAQHFSGPLRYYLEVPGAPHGALMYAPGSGGVPCGMQLTLDFLARPQAPLDTSCLGRLPAPSYRPAPEYAMALLGTPDAWDGAPQRRKGGLQWERLTPTAARVLRAVRRARRTGRPSF